MKSNNMRRLKVEFVDHKPRKRTTDVRELDKVRVSFRQIKDKNGKINGEAILIYIGRNKGDQAGIDIGDRVDFQYEKANPRIWLVKKSHTGAGYKIGGRPGTSSLKLQVTWKVSEPDQADRQVREVKSDFYKGGIRIFSDKPLQDLTKRYDVDN